jgi:hypothetical protein
MNAHFTTSRPPLDLEKCEQAMPDDFFESSFVGISHKGEYTNHEMHHCKDNHIAKIALKWTLGKPNCLPILCSLITLAMKLLMSHTKAIQEANSF